jgi:hypothetical protein
LPEQAPSAKISTSGAGFELAVREAFIGISLRLGGLTRPS